MNLSHEIVVTALARHLGVHPGAIEGRQLIEDDWGLDALDLALIVARLEDARGLAIDIEHDAFTRLRTVADLTELVRVATEPLLHAREPAVTLRASVREEVRRGARRARRSRMQRQVLRSRRAALRAAR